MWLLNVFTFIIQWGGGGSLNWQPFDLSFFDFSIKLRHCLTDFRKVNSTYITVFLEIYQFFSPTVCKCDSKMTVHGWQEPTPSLVLGCLLFWDNRLALASMWGHDYPLPTGLSTGKIATCIQWAKVRLFNNYGQLYKERLKDLYSNWKYAHVIELLSG